MTEEPSNFDSSQFAGAADPTQALVTQIARALVDHPEEVQVQALEREESTVLRLHVSDSDIGKVIGKQGRTAHSLRTILGAVSMKYHHRYTLDIVEHGDGHDGHPHAPSAETHE
jgi:predicted RNA-binding protein YlqC (UPF0109 family)